MRPSKGTWVVDGKLLSRLEWPKCACSYPVGFVLHLRTYLRLQPETRSRMQWYGLHVQTEAHSQIQLYAKGFRDVFVK